MARCFVLHERYYGRKKQYKTWCQLAFNVSWRVLVCRARARTCPPTFTVCSSHSRYSIVDHFLQCLSYWVRCIRPWSGVAHVTHSHIARTDTFVCTPFEIPATRPLWYYFIFCSRLALSHSPNSRCASSLPALPRKIERKGGKIGWSFFSTAEQQRTWECVLYSYMCVFVCQSYAYSAMQNACCPPHQFLCITKILFVI